MNGADDASAGFATAAAHFLDTSAVIFMMRQRRVASASALLPFAAVAELSIGGFRAANPAREWRRIELTLAAAAGIVYPTPRTLLLYAELSTQMKFAGTPLPVDDLWIAAVAVEWNLPLLTTDKHFSLVPGLRLVSV